MPSPRFQPPDTPPPFQPWSPTVADPPPLAWLPARFNPDKLDLLFQKNGKMRAVFFLLIWEREHLGA